MIKRLSLWPTLLRWFDAEAQADNVSDNRQFNFLRLLPFILLHIACFAVIWVGVSSTALMACAALYFIRMFAITAFYHRYFAHRTFKTNRFWQFIFAFIANSAAQRGPLWWAAHHRHHHQHSDTAADLHSPVQDGFWWSHVGWFSCDAAFKTPWQRIRDFASYPELRFLNRFDALAPALLGIGLFVAGELLALYMPQLNTNGAQLFVWGFVISTVVLFHATVTINSLGHVWGKKRFNTADDSRNNTWLALLTLGEGWHNNHHRFPAAARQGFYWWQVDISYYVLWLMAKLRIVQELRPVPLHILNEGRQHHHSKKGRV
ncbi:MAG: acyl-CoA desaturase [Oceanospirillaceae bacterium]|nr:acyl-CoA desaturase [Oceanospirillaceae bacterium]MCP5335494.1 acyl-CoA desaturase [Oceanospirillaceae bacterium]MCP5349965.1 acyl-CoA desaturase [Oceanospirillaceae bacterium]